MQRPIARRLGFLLLTSGALLLAYGVAGAWWTGASPAFQSSVDLRGLRLCSDAGCASQPLSALGAGSLHWARLALAAQVAAGISMLLGALLAASELRGRGRPAIAWATGGIALFAAALGGLLVAFRPEVGSDLQPGFAMAAYLAGAGLSALGAGALRPASSTPQSGD